MHRVDARSLWVWTLAKIADERPREPTNANTNVIRADFIRFLALGGDEAAPVHEKGVQVEGACVYGQLDLEGVKTLGALHLSKCLFNKPINLSDAHIRGYLLLDASETPGLGGDQLICDSHVYLGTSFLCKGATNLNGAQITGNLACRGGAFKNPGKIALSADGAKVAGVVFLDTLPATNGNAEIAFSAEGEVQLIGADIGQDIICTGGIFKNLGFKALSADRIKVAGNVHLNEGFSAEGAVRFPGAKIGGNLDCNGGAFENMGDPALLADRINVEGYVSFSQTKKKNKMPSSADNEAKMPFSANGEVKLLGARIGGNLECRRGSFRNRSGRALSAAGLTVEGDVSLKEIAAEGVIQLTASKILGAFS